MEGAEHSGNDQGKECIAYDADRLEERAGHVVSKARKVNDWNALHVPSQELDLHCYDGLSDPYHSKDTGEDGCLLVA